MYFKSGWLVLFHMLAVGLRQIALTCKALVSLGYRLSQSLWRLALPSWLKDPAWFDSKRGKYYDKEHNMAWGRRWRETRVNKIILNIKTVFNKLLIRVRRCSQLAIKLFDFIIYLNDRAISRGVYMHRYNLILE